MRMTTEMFINILALVFTVLSAGISIGLYIANKGSSPQCVGR